MNILTDEPPCMLKELALLRMEILRTHLKNIKEYKKNNKKAQIKFVKMSFLTHVNFVRMKESSIITLCMVRKPCSYTLYSQCLNQTEHFLFPTAVIYLQ